ncbi:hypothetical protein DEU56DRAFT_816666 [Suillus clintonianus]|uniref:uncharacterized protein n=1 Tax=Suillus clintonianus TaxID=1904413 RepID=UPI001B866D2D|nr:uncharacterized protein DEU56DRAFT_816666 [Suillus clintonianus]KAG2129782.1 hypothetical protein DEU56DRAFT_816666 [Suillus clintonianus]
MPPKPKPRKVVKAPKSASSQTKFLEPQDTPSDSAMPPPPVPPKAMAILEPEMNALMDCLKNAVVRTGQIYSFHADSRRLGINRYAPYPPRSLTDSLGREVERFDQLYDAMESRLLRAIAVLERDLAREQYRAREAENAAIATRTRSKSTSESPTTRKVPLPPLEVNTDIIMGPPALPAQASPPHGLANPARRGSTISLSSLHRPPFPLKLDLSSSSLRMSAEEAALFSQSLPSPVSLAPKSARPSAQTELDLMAAFASATAGSSQHVDIDLTVDDDPPMAPIDASLGSSADKPIELDLDSIDMEMSTMTDLFGDGTETGSGENSGVEGIFSPVAPDSGASNPAKESQEGGLDMEMLGALSAVDNNNHGNDMFGPSDASGLQSGQHSSLGVQSSPPSNVAPSPSAILASFAGSQSDGTHQLPAGDGNFDLSTLDLSNFDSTFFHRSPDMNLMDMEALLDSMGQSGGNSDGTKPPS